MYYAGWNMPGYLPEMEPFRSNNPTGVVDFLCDEMLRQRAEADYDESVVDRSDWENGWEEIIDEVSKYGSDLGWRGNGDWGAYAPDGYYYWITEEMADDD